MAQIFVSYSHQDAERARVIAAELESRGWTVWWDPAVRAGESFVSLINREIGNASCVLVLWSKASVSSRWVLEEALNGLDRNILCPVVIDSGTQLPVGFATVKYMPLWEWRDGTPVGGFGPIIDQLTKLVGPPAAEASVPKPVAVGPAEINAEAAGTEVETAAPSDGPTAAAKAEPAPVPQRPPSDQYINFSDLWIIDYPVLMLFLLACSIALYTVTLRNFDIAWSIATTFELSTLLAGVAATFGAAIAVRNNRSIQSPAAIYLLGDIIGQRSGGLIRAVVSSGVFAAVAFWMFQHGYVSLMLDEQSASGAALPLGPFKLSLAVGFAFMAIFSFVPLLRKLRRGAP